MNNRKSILWISFLSLILACPSINLFAQRRMLSKAAIKPLPNLMLSSIDGERWSLNEQRGNIVLMNFWATWCLPCLTEIPLLVRLSDKYKENGLEIVGVSVDSENTQQIITFKQNFQISYPLLLTVPGSLLSRQKAIPMTLLIDEKGVLAKKYIGAVKENIIERDIKDLLKKK